MKKLIIGIVCSLLVSSLAHAAEDNTSIYNCTFKTERNKWVADRVMIAHNDDGSIEVADPIAQYFTGGTVKGRLIRENAKVLSLSYEYLTVLHNGSQAKIAVNFTFQKKKGRAQATAQVPGYINHDNARGTCRVRRGIF